MVTETAVEDEQPHPSYCWCCGADQPPAKLVHLGVHPEVTVCLRCARSLSKWAGEVEDRSRRGLVVVARDGFRRLRKLVVRHGWHNNRIVGRGLRWIGRFTP
jgi:hypothetical protein